ncbi:hypothetical protein [Streptomyces litchfieldiae]|uniref:YokE-like PH domain-containing protein n=1 Tax=Streptomyces litchfieldiae TaxID=3075543 RepID=A0ABU2MQQ1_9ACTN|nr:hypothetical protein [Streptomyces sp. DSM 44938]MDT0343223.1 hypothetical protein [Streptomyces sp. DSM 44938]
MPLDKFVIQDKAARKVARANPHDRPLLTFQATAGAMRWLGEVGEWFSQVVWLITFPTQRLFTIALTEHSVVFIRTGRIFTRIKNIKYVIPRAQAATLVHDVKIDPLGDTWFAFKFPRKRRLRRLTVDGEWDQELHYFLAALGHKPPMARRTHRFPLLLAVPEQVPQPQHRPA